jgi:hypothetical protein
LNTSANETIAYGPGCLHNNCPNVDTIFFIQSRNIKGINRESGNDRFKIKITYPKETNEVRQQEVVE